MNAEQERKSDLAVMEAQEYKQKRRLQRILDAHDNVEDQADIAWQEYVTNNISQAAKNIIIQRAVKKLTREVYNLIIETDDEHIKNQYWTGEGAEPLGEIQFQHRSNIEISGLRDFLQTREFYTESWQEEQRARQGPNRQETYTEERTVPEDVTWDAYLKLKEFLSQEHDLELQFEALDDSLPMFGFETVDMSDLDVQEIEEIEELIEGGIDARAVKQNGGDTDE